MEKNHPPFVEKKYERNKFEVKPSKINNLLIVNLSSSRIGYFETHKPIRRDKNGKQIYFFIKSLIGIIGTISFLFNDKTEKWKIAYVKLSKAPQHLVKTRKVLIEKTKNEHNNN